MIVDKVQLTKTYQIFKKELSIDKTHTKDLKIENSAYFVEISDDYRKVYLKNNPNQKEAEETEEKESVEIEQPPTLENIKAAIKRLLTNLI